MKGGVYKHVSKFIHLKEQGLLLYGHFISKAVRNRLRFSLNFRHTPFEKRYTGAN